MLLPDPRVSSHPPLGYTHPHFRNHCFSILEATRQGLNVWPCVLRPLSGLWVLFGGWRGTAGEDLEPHWRPISITPRDSRVTDPSYTPSSSGVTWISCVSGGKVGGSTWALYSCLNVRYLLLSVVILYIKWLWMYLAQMRLGSPMV